MITIINVAYPFAPVNDATPGGLNRLCKYSPGTVALYYVILSAATKGCECIDFMRGEEAYKHYWRVQKESNYSVKIFKNSTSIDVV